MAFPRAGIRNGRARLEGRTGVRATSAGPEKPLLPRSVAFPEWSKAGLCSGATGTVWQKQPGTGAPCCSIADCRTVEFRQDRDGYEVFIDGRWKMSNPFWLRVPPNRIIDRTDNPTNRAGVCFTPEAGILCFVRPAES